MNVTISQNSVKWSTVRSKIQTIPQYTSNVSIQQENIALSRVYPLCLWIRQSRLAHVARLAVAYQDNDIPYFRAVKVLQSEGVEERLLIPPIIETHEDKFVIIDGHHRIYHLRQLGFASVYVVIIGDVRDPLPAEVLDWTEVGITDQVLPRDRKFRNLKNEYFRHINRYIDEFD